MHGNCSARNKSCVDYHWISRSELCYDCSFIDNCYHCFCLDHCQNCNECHFSYDLKGCKHCVFCSNLRQAEYCIFNEQLSREAYNKRLKELRLDTYTGFRRAKNLFLGELRSRFPFRATHQVRCENCEGTNHSNSRNIYGCFEADTSEDVLFSTYLGETYNSIDVNYMGFDRCELSYQCIGCTSLYRGISCDSCWHNSDISYCSYCFSSKNCFGCLSLKRKEYCILNKQYSKEEYERLVPKIVERMREDGEWGEFFPISLSPFAYNETVANDWFPRSKEEAHSAGYRWRDLERSDSAAEEIEIPDCISDVDDSILLATLICAETGRSFRIDRNELKLYRQMGVPLPKTCPDVRQKERLSIHSPWQLWHSRCHKTGVQIATALNPQGPEQVYSVEAYIKEFGS